MVEKFLSFGITEGLLFCKIRLKQQIETEPKNNAEGVCVVGSEFSILSDGKAFFSSLN